MSMFVHLRLHTEYSVSDGLIRCESLIKRTVDLDMPAIGITDRGNLFCAVKFYKQALEAGIKPLLGSDLVLHDPSEEEVGSVFTVLVKDLKLGLEVTRDCNNPDLIPSTLEGF